MCGIVGYINKDKKAIEHTSDILSMMKIQKHRGPDDSGLVAFNLRSGQCLELNVSEPVYIGGNFEGVLGFNRLSILDLSKRGHQPMVSPDGKVYLTLNGEIYNAFDYKAELESWGYKFKSTTDTEIVLALYLKYGYEHMLSLLNGMFAISIVDMVQQEIFIARDRFGIKPMYYFSTKDIFAFSSELKSFRYVTNFEFELDDEKLDEFLLFRNNIGGTLFKNIKSLDPGHFLIFKPDKELLVKRYFNLNDYNRSVDLAGDIGAYMENLEGLLSKSVQSQLMSDVKLGCQLSGGIDSSLITWLANRNSGKGNFETVSIIFNNKKFNEEKYINRVIEKLGITSHQFLLDSEYYLDNIERATWHLEAPINHPHTVAILKLSQQAKNYVTVLLSGEGADEVFGGYNRFKDICFPFGSRKLLHEIKKNLNHPFDFADYFGHENRAVMATASMTPTIANKLRMSFNKEKAINERRYLYRSLSGSLFDRQIKYEIQTYLPDLLIRQDKMSMAHSIENRVPFLDNEIVASSFNIPEKYLILKKCPEGSNTEKYLLKRIIADIFGNEFAFREKIGLTIPLRLFIRNKKFTNYLLDKVLPGIKQRGILNHNLILTWISNIDSLPFDKIESLWTVLAFEIWTSIYIDKQNENWYTSN